MTTVMAGEHKNCLERNLYECQMFGFTSKAFMDFVYNVVSRVAGEAVVDIDKKISDQPDLKRLMEKATQERELQDIKDTFCKRLDLNIDRLEMFSKHNIFRVPRNVVLPTDKIQENSDVIDEDEENIDKKLESVMEEIKHSYEKRIALKNELRVLSKLQSMADKTKTNVNQLSIEERYYALICTNAQNHIDALKMLKDAKTNSQSKPVDVSVADQSSLK